MSEIDKDMLGEETLSEQEAAKEFNGQAAAGSVKASIDASAKKKQGARKGDKLGTEDKPGHQGSSGVKLPGEPKSMPEDVDFESMTEEEIDQFIESLSEEELAALEEHLDLEEAKGKKAKCDDDEKEEMEEEVSFQEDIAALCDSEATLSESFRDKAALIFESAFEVKVSREVSRLEESYQEAMVEEVSKIQESLVEQVDAYMNYVVESWMKENELAINTGLRADIAESFINGLQSVFTEHYVEVPESKVDLVDQLAERVQELEGSLSDVMEDNIKLTESVISAERESILQSQSSNLSQTQYEKLKGLSESVDFASAEDFASKVATLKESYFGAHKVITEETAVSESEHLHEEAGDRMSQYLAAIRRSN